MADSNTLFLCSFDGADEATSATDESSSAHTITFRGNAQLDTAQQKFGSASVLFDGSGDDLELADHADWDLGTGDFTIDMQVRFNTTSSTAFLIERGAGSDFALQLRSSGTVIRTQVNGNNNDLSWTPSTATWYHVAFVRTSGTVRLFVDGTQIGSDATQNGSISSNSAVYIGGQGGGGSDFDGWLDEVRISDIARWTSPFTPPSAAYGEGSSSSISSYGRTFNRGIMRGINR